MKESFFKILKAHFSFKIVYHFIFLIIILLLFHTSYWNNRIKALETLEITVDFNKRDEMLIQNDLKVWANRFYVTGVLPKGFCDINIIDKDKKILSELTLKDDYIQCSKIGEHDWKSFMIYDGNLAIRYYTSDYFNKVVFPSLIIFSLFVIVWHIVYKNEKNKKEKILDAQEAARFKTFASITGGIAHNFRNNFHVIKGQLGLLKKEMIACRDLHTRERIKEEMMLANDDIDIELQIKKIKRNMKQCQTIRDNAVIKKIEILEPVVENMIEELEQMLDFIRPNKNIKILNVHEVLHVTTELFENCSGNDIKIKLDAQSNDKEITYLIKGNKQSLMTVFLNILKNSVNAKREDIDLELSANLTFDVKNIYLRFKDNGKGMSKEVRSRVFEPFFTEDRARGTGLGLSSSKAILERIGASINIEWTEENKGTTLLIIFPRNNGELKC